LVARKQVAHTQTERKVLEEIDNPFIVSLRFAFQTGDKLYMILDFFTGGELFFHLKQNGRFNEDRARFYAAEIVLALECLHKHNIIYRDLKPENVLLDGDGHIKLTDFGLSKDSISGSALTHTFCGTPEYLAPEVIHGSGYGQAVDWWSLGTLLYEMLTGLPPFYNENLHVMYEKIIRAKLTFPSYLSAKAISFLTALLERNPKQRLGGGESNAEEVKKHAFFEGMDWDKMSTKEVKVPFKPSVSGEKDVNYVDIEFKSEFPKDTPVQQSSIANRVNFPGFTYNPSDAPMKRDSTVSN
jgi:serine/threonine protein kinase